MSEAENRHQDDEAGEESRSAEGGRERSGAYVFHRYESPPAERAVRWVPRKLAEGGAELPVPYRFYFSQEVFRAVRAHVGEPSDGAEGEVVGLLVGQLFRDPGSGERFVRVERAVRSARRFREDEGAEAFGATLEELVEGLDDAATGRVVGWYHGHSLLGVFLSEQDARIHRRYFPEPWQCALVALTDRRRPAGGLFQHARGGLRRSIYLPFHEVLDEESVAPGGRRRTAVDWRNYVSEEDVVRPAAPLGTVQGSLSPGPRSAPGDARRTGPPPGSGAVPVVVPGGTGGGLRVFLRRHERGLWRGLALAALAAVVWLAWDRGLGFPSAPPAAEAPPAAAAPSGEEERYREAAAAFATAVQGYGDRAEDFDRDRVVCDVLAEGYRRVDDAFIALSAAFAPARRAGAAGVTGRYEEAAGRMEEVDDHFDASACPRPR